MPPKPQFTTNPRTRATIPARVVLFPLVPQFGFQVGDKAIRQQPKDTGDDPRKSRTASADIAGQHQEGTGDTQTRYAGPGSPARGDRGGGARGCRRGKPGGGAKGGAKVVAEACRHEGVFVSRGKEDRLLTRGIAPGIEVYGEKRVSVDRPPRMLTIPSYHQ
ncbi:hypothetical protein DL770_011051 [Monosporascus sp. CRB-9-2]|nr:hypothetical protein DL770_011051 [Monosporascus sp. CRB-9-2]